jgi:uncharacterized protein YkwD
MKTKLYRLSAILLIVMIAACTTTPATIQPTVTPLPAATEQPTSLAVATGVAPTETPAVPPADVTPQANNPTDTPAAIPTIDPATQSSCMHSAEFVTDVTVPDHTDFKPGASFIKTWRVLNSGTCTWDGNDMLVFLKGDQMGAPATTPLTQIPPGQTADISLNLTAPSQNGTYTGYFQLQDPSGEKFAALNLWVIITVGANTVAAAPTATGITPVPTTTGSSGSCTYDQNAASVSQVLTLINAARANNGLPALKPNDKLSASAMVHSVDMACNSFLSHAGSDGSTSKQRMAAQGYNSSATSEMVFGAAPEYGGDAQAAVTWWLNDADHYPIIMSPKYTEFGAGYAHTATSALGGYFTVDFGAPK